MRNVYIHSKRNIIIRCIFLVPFVPIVLIAAGITQLYEVYSELMWELLPNDIVKKTSLKVQCETCQSHGGCVKSRTDYIEQDLWCWNPKKPKKEKKSPSLSNYDMGDNHECKMLSQGDEKCTICGKKMF